MEYLSLRTSLSEYHWLYFVFSVFVDTDCNKRGKTSRPVARAQIQTSCNFEENISRCSRVLGCVYSRHNNVLLESPYNFIVWKHRYSTVPSHLNFLLHKNFPHSSPQPKSSTEPRSSKTTEPSNSLNIARYRKAVSSAPWVQVTLVVCYLPYGIVTALMPQRGLPFSNFLAWQYTVT